MSQKTGPSKKQKSFFHLYGKVFYEFTKEKRKSKRSQEKLITSYELKPAWFYVFKPHPTQNSSPRLYLISWEEMRSLFFCLPMAFESCPDTSQMLSVSLLQHVLLCAATLFFISVSPELNGSILLLCYLVLRIKMLSDGFHAVYI